MIIINNPNNPTGQVIAGDVLQGIADFAEQRGIILLSDEVYRPLFHDQSEGSLSVPPSATALRCSRTVVTGSMSKAFSLAGIRVGWIVCKDAGIMEAMVAARDYTTISVSQLDDQVASYALSPAVNKPLLERNLSLARHNAGLVNAFVESHTSVCRWVRPVAGTTAFIQFLKRGKPVNDVDFCVDLLNATKVLVCPGSHCFGGDHDFEGFVRVGYVCDTAVLEEALRRLGRYSVDEPLGTKVALGSCLANAGRTRDLDGVDDDGCAVGVSRDEDRARAEFDAPVRRRLELTRRYETYQSSGPSSCLMRLRFGSRRGANLAYPRKGGSLADGNHFIAHLALSDGTPPGTSSVAPPREAGFPTWTSGGWIERDGGGKLDGGIIRPVGLTGNTRGSARLISSSALRCRAAVSDPDPTAATPGLKSFLPASRARMMRAGAASWQHSLDVLPSLQRRVQVRTWYLGLPRNQRRHEGNENGHSPWPTRLDRVEPSSCWRLQRALAARVTTGGQGKADRRDSPSNPAPSRRGPSRRPSIKRHRRAAFEGAVGKAARIASLTTPD
ncbi:hypothetical protein Purlil1_7483 [Purpureocillium lilacinum]|uniref:Aminotransferase class I/classII large domain-containing protein n=1 Tax=Purpureocillium lilacinum TaxID=33203 RepID=A0ABR0BWD4_PURLI|nr:hypothetical protein Purlil1_7483 [Purpureocillium lilacinum]